jgi:hypothetical protein
MIGALADIKNDHHGEMIGMGVGAAAGTAVAVHLLRK